jgi:hypothetical protein
MGKDQRQQIYVGFVADIDIKILGVPPPGPGMPFLDSNTCAEGRGVYLFLPGFSSLYDAIHGWMTGRMDGKLHEKQPRRPLLYVMYTFFICLLNTTFCK